MACEPFYTKPSYRILATCSLYFPTTMVVMYCYGSSFHMSHFRLHDPAQIAAATSTTSTTNPLATPNSLNLSLAMGVVGMSSTGAITKKVGMTFVHCSVNKKTGCLFFFLFGRWHRLRTFTTTLHQDP